MPTLAAMVSRVVARYPCSPKQMAAARTISSWRRVRRLAAAPVRT